MVVLFCSRNAKRVGGKLPGKYLMADVVGFSTRSADEQYPVQYLRFSELRNTLDTVCVGQGIGTEVSHAPVVLYEHEMLMWKSCVLGF